MRLLQDGDLERSGVVANCCMNRQRSLSGSNGYCKQLGFHPLDWLLERSGRPARWLDLCCGSALALIEAAQAVHERGLAERVAILGVDLVAPRVPSDSRLACLRLEAASLSGWRPAGRFNLITCVHGLHYIGDKLGLIARAASWLSDGGLLAANLDLANVKFAGGRPATRAVAAALRGNGLEYDTRRRLLHCRGRRTPRFSFQYLGADDAAGPNYTGQPAVDSYYDTVQAAERESRNGRCKRSKAI